MDDPTLSPGARRALAQLLTNERRGVLTHRSAVHPSTREMLIGRGLVEWRVIDEFGTRAFERLLALTGKGRTVAEGLDERVAS